MNPQKNTSQAEVRLQVLLLLLLLVTTLIVSRVARDHPQVKNPPETEEAAGEASSGEVFRIVFEDPEALQAWRCLSFAGKSTYSIKKKPAGDLALHARSQNNYSSLFRVVDVPLRAQPTLVWQ